MKNGLKILLLADSWQVTALGMIAPIYAIFVERIGGDLLDASWAYFAFMMSTGVTIFLISHWEDKIKHKEKLIMLGYVLTVAGAMMYIFVFNQFTLIITQIVLGLAQAIKDPAYDALYSDYLDTGKKASEWGDWESMYYVATALAAILGGYIATVLGFRALFVGMAIFSIFSALVCINLFRKKEYLHSKELLR
ncbi:MAG: MFS transporter [Candidatus Roizmanbacteria bacterium]|nr:MAG: MFS transporter [Candidatus Roizmanbacteria bacterium]